MASSRSIVRLVAERATTPAAVLTQLNDVQLSDFPRSKFVTMVYALLNAADRSVTFASAGHNPPLLVSQEGSRFVESMTGFPLGIWNGPFSEQHLELTPGSRFVLYSDGVSEAANLASEEFGDSRIQGHFNSSASSVDSLLQDVYQFSAGAPLADDATVVLIDTIAS
jgi:sigma-B regulation protein RsbU (phosphoserine phosphatase)